VKYLLWLCVVAGLALVPGFAQTRHKIEVSAYVGVPLNHTLRDAFCCSTAALYISHATDDAPYITGLSAGFVLADRIHVTFGAMFMPVSFREIGTVDNPPVHRVTSTTHGTAWEFPLLGDYRWLNGAVRPFSGGGFVIANRTSGNQTYGPSQSPAPIVSGGVEWLRQRFVIRPEIRYTHYHQNDNSNVAVGRPSTQIQILIGVTYRM
jgi:hypothetical protein